MTKNPFMLTLELRSHASKLALVGIRASLVSSLGMLPSSVWSKL